MEEYNETCKDVVYRSKIHILFIYSFETNSFFSLRFEDSPYFQAKSDLVARVNTTTLRSGIVVHELHRILLPRIDTKL